MSILDELKAHNQRQFKLMLRLLQAYQNNETSLWQLAIDLPALHDALEQVDSRWKEDFFNLSSGLDYSWLILHDEQLSDDIKIQEKKDVSEVIKRLTELVTDQIVEDHLV